MPSPAQETEEVWNGGAFGRSVSLSFDLAVCNLTCNQPCNNCRQSDWSRELINALIHSGTGVKADSKDTARDTTDRNNAMLARRFAWRFSYKKAFPFSVILGW